MFKVYSDEAPHWEPRTLYQLKDFFERNRKEHGYQFFEDWLDVMLRFDLIRRVSK